MRRAKAIEIPTLEQPAIAPFIDVVFQLLIFFMLTLQFTDMTVEKLKLPEASDPKTIAATPGLLIVNIKRDGTITIGGQVFYDGSRERSAADERNAFTRLESLFAQRHAKAEYRQDPSRPESPAKYPVLVRADRSTPFEQLQRVLMMASRYGKVERVLFASEGEEKRGE
jgi:biopolymer transport protein ExbD